MTILSLIKNEMYLFIEKTNQTPKYLFIGANEVAYLREHFKLLSLHDGTLFDMKIVEVKAATLIKVSI